VDLERLSARVGDTGTLRADVQRAREATDAFARWLDAQVPSKRAPSGVGVENYDWYLKNVQLVSYTWQDEVTAKWCSMGWKTLRSCASERVAASRRK